MSARTRYYIKAWVLTERWFVANGVTGDDAIEELEKTEDIYNVSKVTCDPTPEERHELQNFIL